MTSLKNVKFESPSCFPLDFLGRRFEMSCLVLISCTTLTFWTRSPRRLGYETVSKWCFGRLRTCQPVPNNHTGRLLFGEIHRGSAGRNEHCQPSGLPIYAKTFRLAPDKFGIAGAEFGHMLEPGIISATDNPWASALRMVPKESGDWRSVDNCTLTGADRFPILHIQNPAANLNSARVHSKIDLVCAYHQIPVAEADIPGSAIVTLFGP